MTHKEIFNLQEQIDVRLDAATGQDVSFWMEHRVVVCKWLDKSGKKGFNGLPDSEMIELYGIQRSLQ